MAELIDALPSAAWLAAAVQDAGERTLELVADLSDEQLLGPQLAIVNPLLWEIGHVAWFQEKWALCHAAGEESPRADADALYDSAAVAHDTRWDLALPSRAGTLAYLCDVRDRVLARLERGEPSPRETYFILLALFHQDMHTEAFTYTRQTHGWPAPRLWGVGCGVSGVGRPSSPTPDTPHPTPASDASLPGGDFLLGATPRLPFVFDNEKWAHPVAVRPFAIARTAVTQAEFAAFVEAGGYRRREFWSADGWRWREEPGGQGTRPAEHPVYWRREGSGWLRREFDRWGALEPNRPVLHVCWHEAEAYCRWAGRRLPSEAEWELAASAERAADGREMTGRKRVFPWGDTPPDPERAHLDWGATAGSGPSASGSGRLGCLEVGALPEGDSDFGCRQMIGNVWEWTASDFLPYPGFAIDPYKEYSEPWFATHKVLRGGCWATRSRLPRNTWRNFYRPDRRDVWAGFRTCAL